MFLQVRERANTRQLYVHDEFLEDEIKKADSLQTSPRGKTTTATRGTSLCKSILHGIYAADNASVSKVVDSNGEPKASDIKTFSQDRNILYQFSGNIREESQAAEAERYAQRGFMESSEPSAEDKLKRDIQDCYKKVDLIESTKESRSILLRYSRLQQGKGVLF